MTRNGKRKGGGCLRLGWTAAQRVPAFLAFQTLVYIRHDWLTIWSVDGRFERRNRFADKLMSLLQESFVFAETFKVSQRGVDR